MLSLCSQIQFLTQYFLTNMDALQKQRKIGFINLLSQKLSQKLDSLPQIQHLSQRWIWQLIQNAKDAGSQFNKIKIKLILTEDKFIFTHTGTPFTLDNLYSLLFHYSTKQDQNKDDIETTGKYGTGFMVTYVLSKKVSVNCKLREANTASIIQTEAIVKKQTKTKSKAKMKQQKSQHQQSIGRQSYQQINILMDRQYKQIKQLKDKLLIIDTSLTNQIQTKPKIITHIRDQDSYDTQFIYQGLDKTSIKNISDALDSIKKLFPLTLLFNPCLFSLEFNNQTNKLSNISDFSIERDRESSSSIKLGILDIFSASIVEKKQAKKGARKSEAKTTIHYLYQQIPNIKATIAFPIYLQKDQFNILSIDSNFPKIFKQFPLIGCKDTGLNFIFTSKQLYPAQNRKQLLLKKIQGRDGGKAALNIKILQNIIKQAKNIFILMSQYVSKGKFKLFQIQQDKIIPHGTQGTNLIKQIQQLRVTAYKLQMFSHEIIIHDLQKKLMHTTHKKISVSDFDHIYSPHFAQQTFETFKFLVKNPLSKEDFLQFAQFASKKTYLYAHLYQFLKNKPLNFEDLIQKIQKITFSGIKSSFGNSVQAYKQLSNIYSYLLDHRIDVLFSKKVILLNQNETFSSFQIDDIKNMKIQINFPFKQNYASIAKNMNSNYLSQLIHPYFTQLFFSYHTKFMANNKKTNHKHNQDVNKWINSLLFTQQDYLSLFQAIFNEHKLKDVSKAIIYMGRFLSSFFRIHAPLRNHMLKVQQYNKIMTPFCNIITNETSIKPFNAKIQGQLIQLFINKMKGKCIKSQNLTAFSKLFIDSNKESAIQLIAQLLNNHRSLWNIGINGYQLLIQLSQFNIFNTSIIHYQLCYVKDFNIFNKFDYQIYKKYYKEHNRNNGTSLKYIRQFTFHPKITFNGACNNETNYNKMFLWLKSYYYHQKTPMEHKEDILNYTFFIYQQFILKQKKQYEAKYTTFKEIINDRHLQFGKLLNTLNNDDKDLICKIFRMKDKFTELRELINNHKIQEVLAIVKKIKK